MLCQIQPSFVSMYWFVEKRSAYGQSPEDVLKEP